MASSVVTHKRKVQARTKVKTGCATCKIRKVKCDEGKPYCQKCVSTGRTCDGYPSVFRASFDQSVKHPATSSSKNVEVTTEDIELLNRYFSTKTVFDVKLACNEEAKQILQASLNNAPIRHAVSALRALREDYETSVDSPESINYGLQQYNMALRGLASNLLSSGSDGLRSALLCCQVFISIEQVQQNYASMAQHIIRGLRIMRECRARPFLSVANELMAPHHGELPLLDVFIIKIFVAPCKFLDPQSIVNASKTTSFVQTSDTRTIMPDMRSELTRIATSLLELLSDVSQVQTADAALKLLLEKTVLLESLNSWLNKLELSLDEIRTSRPELISITFKRLFHSILKLILRGVLNTTSELQAELRMENERVQSIADSLSEKLKSYKKYQATGGS